MKRLKAIGAFWYDFVVGDDWRVATVVVVALALTALLVHAAGVNAWWLLPVCVFAALGWSLRRATAGSSPDRSRLNTAHLSPPAALAPFGAATGPPERGDTGLSAPWGVLEPGFHDAAIRSAADGGRPPTLPGTQPPSPRTRVSSRVSVMPGSTR